MPLATQPNPRTAAARSVGGAACAAVLATCACLAAVSPAAAQSPDPSTVTLTALRLQLVGHQAERDAAEWENRSGAPAADRADGVNIGTRKNPKDILRQLGLDPVSLGQSYAEWRRSLIALSDKAATERAAAEKAWAAVYARRISFQSYVDREEDRYGFDFQANSPAPFKLKLIDAAVIGWATLALGVGLLLALREGRVRIRRRLRARQVAVAAALLVTVTGPAGCGGAAGLSKKAPWASREEEELVRLAAETRAGVSAVQAQNDDRWQKAVEGWAALLRVPEAEEPSSERVLIKLETDIRDHVRRLLVSTRVAELLAAEAQADRARLADDEARLAGMVAAARRQVLLGAVGRIAAGGGLLGLAISPLAWARWRHKRFLRSQGRVCPRCLAVGKLATRAADTKDDRYPEPVYLECEACDYRFRRSYQNLPRLCFPTVGVRSSGKTHMLTAVFDRVENSAVPTDAAVQRVAPLGDDQWETQRDLVFRMHGSAGATDYHSLPDPLILQVRDTDRFGPSAVLTNLFDYAGQLMNERVDTDLLRRRALLMDGFVLFLDPTQIYGRGSLLRLEDQLKKLNEFYEDMREMRGVAVGQPIPVPIAVCISKFDLLVSDNPIRQQSVPFIKHLLTQLNPPGAVTLGVLKARSDTVEQMLPLIFPGLNLRQKLADCFGGQVMFFPVSSVSLFEHELGVKDMSRRTVAPFGVAEPILWLLHMHGYQTLDG